MLKYIKTKFHYQKYEAEICKLIKYDDKICGIRTKISNLEKFAIHVNEFFLVISMSNQSLIINLNKNMFYLFIQIKI